ncbi:MAG: amidohydrolase family protein [Abditibacteriaceae bacterium]
MNSNNIARSLTTASSGIFYDFRQGNTETLEAAKAYPQQLYPVGTLDPRAYPACLEEAEKRASEGFRLFRFFPSFQQWPINFAPFREVVRKCDELNVPIAVQVGNPGECTELADLVAFTEAPLLLAGVRPQQLGEVLAVMKSDPKFYLETTYLQGYSIFETVRDTIPDGAERIVFASFSPLRYLSAALGPVVTSGLSEDEKALVLGGNLKRLLAN